MSGPPDYHHNGVTWDRHDPPNRHDYNCPDCGGRYYHRPDCRRGCP